MPLGNHHAQSTARNGSQREDQECNVVAVVPAVIEFQLTCLNDQVEMKH